MRSHSAYPRTCAASWRGCASVRRDPPANAAEELRSLRERLRPYAEAKGFLTDEDVFKAVS